MTAMMTAAVYYGAHDIRIERVPVPAPAPEEALLRVRRCGVCGTDASEWSAGPIIFPVRRTHPVSGHQGPMIPGHEFVGEVVSAPEGSGLTAGDIVVSGAGVSCGNCARCHEGRTNICDRYFTLGLNVDGALAEYVACPVGALARVPASLSLDAAGLAQPLAVGLHAARRSGVADGDRVVVIGAGAIGTFVLLGLRYLFTDLDITVIDFAGAKLDRALRLGATRVVEPRDDLVDAVLGAIGPTGADVVVEGSGAPDQLSRAIAMTRYGGRVLAVGLPKRPPAVDVHTLVLREITLDTTMAHVCGDDLPSALDLLARSEVAGELLEDVVALDGLTDVLDRLAAGRLDGKVLIDPSQGAGR
ncbi:2,3-butanediol dehydrogenase [Sphaerisporangium krabiense]|uniref:(R,R)-butanediol dehydrogenase/meso-butanediol dehydrogenase/diacetyl reductase n=1 Tax=Sphaerisporangium krabiense TaxID=763782 RepID=A0A7W8Z0G9_9ACTN|nr:alcohol dehydrogenase catalytic domain-containing protein [Sphaerisporangium krabiense]MBB5625136.1 (R,R)-butanediol dehydrogenase/meso-butanediol dehydrogenase/diacetyl reductase [Sphaerisporangium krabiense]GII64355.1 2,3-butanediol dehydrogenase [Sphaerisporangium krabiense]